MDAILGERSISLKALTDFSKLDIRTKHHLKNVYASLSISTLSAAAGAAVHLFTDTLKVTDINQGQHISPLWKVYLATGGFLAGLVGIGLMLALAFTPHEPKNQLKRLGFLVGFAFCTGLGLGPLMDAVIEIDPSIVPTSFLATCLIFVCFSLSALWAEDRKYLYFGGTLMSGLTVLCVLGLLNIFLGSYLLFKIQLYGGLLLFCLFILYDTQLIIEKQRNGDTDFIWHSVDLFLDFINIFRRIMIILAQDKLGGFVQAIATSALIAVYQGEQKEEKLMQE